MPGKLTKEEFETMKEHTLIGASMLDKLEHYKDEKMIKIAYQICRWHHERYDGKGYPRGLKGEDIPLLGRILAVCDSFDAMTTKRTYKEAMSIDYAISELEHNKGTQFDPKLAEAFIELLKEGKIEV